MTPRARTYLAISLGVAATATIVLAEVLAWPLGIIGSALLGVMAGWVPGYLQPHPGHRAAVEAARPRKATEPKAAESTESLPR